MKLSICKSLLLSCLSLFFFSQCQTGKVKSVQYGGLEIEPLFGQTIQTKQNLIFRFSKALVKPEQIGKWDTTQFIQIHPRVVGQYKWAAVDELVFSPDKGFGFATGYSANPARSLSKLAGEELTGEPIRFETEQLAITNCESHWFKDPQNQVMLRLTLQLNQAVLPDELAPALSLLIDGKKVAFEPENHFPTAQISLKMKADGWVSNAGNLKLKAEISTAKLPAGLKKWMKTDQKFEGEIISASQLVVYGLDVNYGESSTSLSVRLSQSVNFSTAENDLSAFVSVPGLANLKISPTDKGLDVTGSFPSQSTLELHLKSGLKGTCGGILKEDKTIGFQVGSDKSSIRFASSKALYLPKFGTRKVGIELESVDLLQLSVYQVFPNNMLNSLSSAGGGYNEYGDSEYEDSYYSEYQDDNSTLIYSRSFRVNELEREGDQYLLPLDFKGLPGQKGIFILAISDEDQRYVGARKLVAITDIGLLAKTSAEEIWVQAQSIASGKPIDRLKVTAIGKNNQPLYTAETNTQGEVAFSRNKLAALGTEPIMLVAENQDDFSYLHFNQTRVETSRFAVDGLPWSVSGWQAEVYGPRNLYKPGERIDLHILLRDKNLAAVATTPLLIKVVSPDGKVAHLLRATTGLFGEARSNFIIPTYFKTGTYQAEIYGGANELLATHPLHIETFTPLPLVIQTGSIPAELSFGKAWNLEMNVETMFGLPAAERPVEVALSWKQAYFSPSGYDSYSFSFNGTGNENMEIVNATTDAKGMARLNFPLTGIGANQGLMDVKARIQVSDESNTPVYKTVSSLLLTQPSLLGYKVKGNRLYFRRSNKLELVSVNAKSELVPARAYVEIYSTKWSSVMEKAPEEPSGYRYVSREVRKLELSQTVVLGQGKGSMTFIPTLTGNYEIQIKSDPSTKQYLTFNTYVYESDNQAPPGDEADTEGNVEIACSQKSLTPGQEAQIRFTTPFDGKLLVTLEQNRILKSYQLEAKGKSAILSLPITSEMAPNAFISATLTRNIGKEGHQNPLTVAYGYYSLPVVLTDKELKTNIKVSTNSYSGVKLPITIELSSANESGLALAVVDEGILGITNYKIPDPFDYFHSKKALAVETYGLYGKIFKSLTGGKSGIGGDGMYLKMAQNSDKNEEVSVMMASGNAEAKSISAKSKSKDEPSGDPNSKSTLKLLQNGQTKVYQAMVDLPAGFSGKVRIMAVSYNAGQVGFAEKVVTVADPITIKASAPDYLFPGDRFDGSASFFNTGKSALTFKPILSGSKISSPSGNWPTQITVGPGQVSRLPFSLTGLSEGSVKVSFEAKAGKETFRLVKNFEIKQPAWIIRHQISGELKAGESTNLSKPDFISSKGLKADFEISNNPFLSMAPAISNLLRYPYGCLEQTISASFPLLYMPDEWLQDLPSLPKTQAGQKWKKAQYVADAIQKVIGMQTYSGGFAYWPSSDDPVDYYSVYATHFLWEARQSGYSVDPSVLTKAQQFLEKNLAIKSEMSYSIGYDIKGTRMTRSYLNPSIPYALYVNALIGKPNRQSLLQWKAQPESLDQEGRYMVACALLLAGDPESFQKLIPANWTKTLETDFEVEELRKNHSRTDFTKTSSQEEAFVLTALVSAWPTHPMVKILSTRLRNKITAQADLLSTQEEGMALVALCRMMKQDEGKEKSLTASRDGKILLQNKTGKALLGGWQTPLSVQNQNKSTPLYYWINAQGISALGKVPETDQGLEVRKTYYSALGKPIDPSTLTINSLVVVRLSLKSGLGRPVPQVALVDVVPSCLRIENGRIGQESGFITPTKPATPDYLDIRRDRIHFFCTATKQESSYYYTARVVGMGSFFWGPADAQSMYQNTLFSRHGSVSLRISAKAREGIVKR